MPWMEQLHSADWTQATWIGFGAYFLGCFTTGYYLIRMRTGQDVRDLGSGNVGAKNVGRLMGWPGFMLTLLGDFFKGVFAVWAARHFTTDDRIVIIAMLAVVAGHVWPVQLLFRGGKGMATSLGVILIYDYHLAAAFLICFSCAFALLRKTVLPGLFAFACLPFVMHYLDHNPAKTCGISLLAALILIAHRRNLMDEFLHLLEPREMKPKHNRTKV
jgi:acyl phosphate:glycerol-3-phosphate acyltransferase